MQREIDPVLIDIPQLKAVVCRLMDELVTKLGSTTVQLPDDDFYWVVPDVALMNTLEKPSEFEVGRLRDDWSLTHWLAGEPAEVSAYSLTEIAPLLHFLGLSVVKKGEPIKDA